MSKAGVRHPTRIVGGGTGSQFLLFGILGYNPSPRRRVVVTQE